MAKMQNPTAPSAEEIYAQALEFYAAMPEGESIGSAEHLHAAGRVVGIDTGELALAARRMARTMNASAPFETGEEWQVGFIMGVLVGRYLPR